MHGNVTKQAQHSGCLKTEREKNTKFVAAKRRKKENKTQNKSSEPMYVYLCTYRQSKHMIAKTKTAIDAGNTV